MPFSPSPERVPFLSSQSGLRKDGGIWGLVKASLSSRPRGQDALTSDEIISTLFVGNFVGIVFARSLHYQFYVWYYHTLVYLLWTTELPVAARLLVVAGIELAWNVYPSRWWSSAILFACHITILAALFVRRGAAVPAKEARAKVK